MLTSEQQVSELCAGSRVVCGSYQAKGYKVQFSLCPSLPLWVCKAGFSPASLVSASLSIGPGSDFPLLPPHPPSPSLTEDSLEVAPHLYLSPSPRLH